MLNYSNWQPKGPWPRYEPVASAANLGQCMLTCYLPPMRLDGLKVQAGRRSCSPPLANHALPPSSCCPRRWRCVARANSSPHWRPCLKQNLPLYSQNAPPTLSWKASARNVPVLDLGWQPHPAPHSLRSTRLQPLTVVDKALLGNDLHQQCHGAHTETLALCNHGMPPKAAALEH